MMSSLDLGIRRPEDYNCLTPVLHEVNRAVIALDHHSKKRAVNRADKVVGCIVELLKAGDDTFRKVYNGIRHVGSYYDGLRVADPTEFDINIVLKFPFHKICKVQKSTVPGFVQVCVEGNDRPWSLLSPRHSMDWTLKTIVDDSGYIRRDKVLEWWQSMFDRLIKKKSQIDGENYEIKWHTSGPAYTVSIMDRHLAIDIDLVPVLMFQDGDASSPCPLYQSWIKENGCPKEWYIVPKPLRDDRDSNRLWRLSFTDQEKVIMNRLEHLKPTNRLMKRLRDNFGWKKLCSFYIKNVFICEAQKKRSYNEEIFFRHNLGYLFVYFLGIIKDRLKRNTLPYFWDSDMNLFCRIEPETAYNIYHCVERILRKIHLYIDDDDTSSLNNFVRNVLIGGHVVCNESNHHHPSTQSLFPNRQYSESYGRQNSSIFRDNCSRCQKVAAKMPAEWS